MSEQDSHKTSEHSTGMAIMPPEKIATNDLAREMAGKIALDMVGTGTGEDELKGAYNAAYALRRNELEHIAGHEDPYAEKQIQSGEISGDTKK